MFISLLLIYIYVQSFVFVITEDQHVRWWTLPGFCWHCFWRFWCVGRRIQRC